MKRLFGLIIFIIVMMMLVKYAVSAVDPIDFSSYFEQYGISCTGYDSGHHFGGGSSRGAGNGGRR